MSDEEGTMTDSAIEKTRWRRVGLGMASLCGALAACSGDVDSSLVDASGSGPAYMDAPGPSGEPANLMGTTAAHNQVRAAVTSTTPLPPMKWDPALANHAMSCTSQCKDTYGNGLVDHS